MEEQSAVKKKYMNNVTFDDLPTELKVEILRRLSGKELACLTCVSHSWQDLITVSCFSTMAASPLSISGSVYVQKDSSRLFKYRDFIYTLNHQSLEFEVDNSFRFVRLDRLEPHQSNITLAKWMASCNGLVLIRRGDRNAERQRTFYHYYVINPKTDQYVQVTKPFCTSSVCSYAALAFHPAESRFFKIVRFQGFRNLNIFNSETGVWATSPFELGKDVTKAKWVEQSAYLQGAIYRISESGHMLRFKVDKVVSKKDLARAIDIPSAIDKSEIPKLHLGLSNGRIHLGMYGIERTDLKIWVLEEDYQWSLKCSFCCPQISGFCDSPVQSIGFHPYDEDVIFVSYFKSELDNSLELKCLRYHEQKPIVENSRSSYGLLHFSGPICLLLQCKVPFACSKLQIKPLKKQ